ncbi:AraC family transcriptional regulator [Chryseobacterium wangxinyae]|uniref:AraC family transcriptional regulator n=1 Tax=Chryseobacterium sp. CY353 TaxID=2997334 RepID=UPI00227127E9|nr:AraC family transcriptional regulator [Chryseobacterium sp. CY353]MCY0971115.1 helix-turn-helix domain-containing protein [Chryseobacterium sp. CY353]
MLKFILSLTLFIFLSVPAQIKDDFERKCLETHAETSMPKAFKVADSLYKASDTPEKKAKSLMLLSMLHQQIGNTRKVFSYGEKAKSYISLTKDYQWNFRITGYLASEYRIVGLYNEAEEYVTEAQEILEKIENPKDAMQGKILISQEIAYHEIHKKRYQKAIGQIKVSIDYLQKLKPENIYYTDFIFANSYEMLGECYFHLNNYSESEKYFYEAKKLLKEPTYQLGFVYNGLGNIDVKTKNWPSAKENLDKANSIAQKTNYEALKIQVYMSYSRYYESINKPEIAAKYYKKHIEANDKLNLENQEFINESFSKLDRANTVSNKKNINKTYLIILLIILAAVLSIFARIRYKKQHRRFTAIIDSMQKIKIPNQEVQNFIEKADVEKKSESPMSPDTEIKLLSLLEEFEKGTEFNDKNMSLTTLAAKFNTNIRYLSYVINTHKQGEFKNYINKLRIDYIIERLTSEEKYRNYKISALADECGFSSHSKFAAVFKSFTDLTPSVFISFLNKNIDK